MARKNSHVIRWRFSKNFTYTWFDTEGKPIPDITQEVYEHQQEL